MSPSAALGGALLDREGGCPHPQRLAGALLDREGGCPHPQRLAGRLDDALPLRFATDSQTTWPCEEQRYKYD